MAEQANGCGMRSSESKSAREARVLGSLATASQFGFRLTLTLCVAVCVGCGKKSVPAGDDSNVTPEVVTPLDEPQPVAPPAENSVPDGPADPQIQTEPTPRRQVYRRSDDRVVVNEQRLAGTNIRRYESRRLVLYTDLDPAIARTLPAYADHLYEELVRCLGELPENREGTEFQATGYLMSERQIFRERDLWPQRVPQFQTGRHLGYEFWLFDQTKDYYRRHLMLHEFTHCFMSCVTGTTNAPPAWYMEGTAEFFATHRRTADGIQFGVMPENRADYAGHDRILMLNREPPGGRKELAEVANISPADNMLYPWAWAKCWFLMNHPRTRDRFRAIGTHLTAAEFAERWEPLVRSSRPQLRTEWYVFLNQLCSGYDVARGATRFAHGEPLAVGASVQVSVEAARGWQSSKVTLEAEGVYQVVASGQFQVDDQPKPWVSEADGVSIQYVGDHRLGCLMGAIYDEAKSASLTQGVSLGASAELSNRRGVLYLRVNDRMNSLANNAGELSVKITRTR